MLDDVILEVRRVRHAYQGRTGTHSVKALNGVTFQVKKNQICAVVGKSGFGKTTLLRIIGGLLAPTGGQVFYKHSLIAGPLPDMGIVFQDYTKSLMPWLNVRKNLELGLSLNAAHIQQGLEASYLQDVIDIDRTPTSKDKRGMLDNVVQASLELVGLNGCDKLFPWELSGGMQQRVALARAITRAPEILLLDEAFGALDQPTKIGLEDTLLDIASTLHMTVLMITHDIDEAIYVADRVLLMTESEGVLDFEVDLPRPRDQVTTRADMRFAELRSRLFEGMGLLQGAVA